jgi:peptide/nickel transport system substrate-binding protein
MRRKNLSNLLIALSLLLALLPAACGGDEKKEIEVTAVAKETVIEKATVVEKETVVETVVVEATEAPSAPSAPSPPLDLPNYTSPPLTYFENYGVNPFVDTQDDHLSTFAIDVDTASYSLMRRYLNEGYLPPKDAVRVEEYVNYFYQDYAPPQQGAFAIHLDGSPSPFGEQDDYLLRVGIQGYQIPPAQRKDAALVFVIDISSSMNKENRLELVKKSLRLLVNELRPTDTVGIVVYGSRSRVFLKPTPASQAHIILSVIDQLRTSGSTNAEEGLVMGYKLAARNFKVGGINRIILCSDGVANVGNTDPDAILAQVRDYAAQGITLSTVGFGMGNYNDVLMEQLADDGDGNYAYVDTLDEAQRIFVDNLSGTLQVIAKDAKIQVDFNPGVVSHYRLIGYENRDVADEDFRDDDVDAGEIGAGHNVTALYELRFHQGAQGSALTAHVRYEDPETGEVREIAQSMDRADFSTFEEMPARFRLTAAVAAYADILRHGPWSKEGNLATVTELARQVAAELPNDPDVVEFAALVHQVNSRQAKVNPSDSLVICIGAEPDTLYKYGGSTLAAAHIQEAIYDGPIDTNSFSFQPVILEKLPSLADGDAIIETVTVQAGDQVLDDGGEPVVLEQSTRIRPAGCYDPACAITFDGTPVEMERMVVTFKLMEGITWSDGQALTAHDSLYSFELAANPDTPTDKFTVDRTASYTALDDYTVVWTGLPGYRDTTYSINFWSPLPEHRWSQYSALQLLEAKESSRLPLGWGPYVITEWVAGDHITLVRNTNYWRADEGLPRFETATFRFVGQNSNANIAAILSGECDIVDQEARLDEQSELMLELQAADQLNAAFVTSMVWEHADLGILPVESYDRPDFFGDVRTRRAIAHCMDRQAVVDTVLFGQSVVPDTYVPPQHPLFNPQAAYYDFDVAKGAALLEEVGWIDDDGDSSTPRVAQGVQGIADGTLLEFNYWTTSATQRQQATQVLQASLAECGIKVHLEYWSLGEYFADGPDGPILGRHFDVSQFAWLTGVEPPCNLFISQEITGPPENGFCGCGCNNNTGWANDDYDAACNAALQSLPGTPEYEQYHLEAQRIFAEQLPVIPLYLRFKLAATHPDMQNFIMDPTAKSEMWNIEEFHYGP